MHFIYIIMTIHPCDSFLPATFLQLTASSDSDLPPSLAQQTKSNPHPNFFVFSIIFFTQMRITNRSCYFRYIATLKIKLKSNI